MSETSGALPTFRYHPEPIASGSVEASDAKCVCCKQHRNWIYVGPVYSEEDLDRALCPWCIADGLAHQRFDATFVDEEVLDKRGDWPEGVADEIATRTPGFVTWQSDAWPGCCRNATAFIAPMGLKEVRKYNYEYEGMIMGHIVYNMQISGGAAMRLLDTLNRENGPTVYVFKCLHCNAGRFHIDRP